MSATVEGYDLDPSSGHIHKVHMDDDGDGEADTTLTVPAPGDGWDGEIRDAQEDGDDIEYEADANDVITEWRNNG